MRACRICCQTRHFVSKLQQHSLPTSNRIYRPSISLLNNARRCFSSLDPASSNTPISQTDDSLEPPPFTAFDEFDAPVDPGIRYMGKANRGFLSPLIDHQTRNLLLELEQLDDLDSCLQSLTQMILTNGEALEPDNYSYIIRVLYKHAGFIPGTRQDTLDPNQIDNYCGVLMGVWASSIAFNRWQLSMRSYGCLIYLLAHFNHPGAFEIYYALQKVDTVILDDATTGYLMSMAYRLKEYDRVMDLWQDMHVRYLALRHTFNKSEYQLQTEWRWTDEKRKEFDYLITNIPCQQMWMYEYALRAANILRRTQNADVIVSRLIRWEEEYALAQKKLWNPDLIPTNDGSSILNDSIKRNRLIQKPQRTLRTYELILVHFTLSKNLTTMMRTLGQMSALGIQLNEKMAASVVKLLAAEEQYEGLLSFLCHVEHEKRLLVPSVVAPALLAIMKRERFERNYIDSRFADASQQHITRILDSFFQHSIRKGRIEIHPANDSLDRQVMLVHTRPKMDEHPQHIIVLALMKASLMMESSATEIDVWFDSFESVKTATDTMNNWGAWGLTPEKCEPDVLARFKPVVSHSSEHQVYVSPVQVHAFRSRLDEKLPVDSSAKRFSAEKLIQTRLASRYHCLWPEMRTGLSNWLSPAVADFVRVWSLHTSPTLLLHSMITASPYSVQQRFGFMKTRSNLIVNATSNLNKHHLLYLPPQLTPHWDNAIDPAGLDINSSLLCLKHESASTACAAVYIFLEFISHTVQSGIDQTGDLYIRSHSLAVLESVRLMIQHHTTLTPVYLLRLTETELDDVGRVAAKDDPYRVPTQATQRELAGYPTKFRKLTHLFDVTMGSSHDKSDLKNVLLITADQLQQQDRVVGVDHVRIAQSIAKQFDLEKENARLSPTRENEPDGTTNNQTDAAQAASLS